MEDNKCVVVNLRKEKYDVYIGRPSKWGNPYYHYEDPKMDPKFRVQTREEAVEKYREWITGKPELMASLSELKGKRLGCFCKPKRCHGDVIAELVNSLQNSI